MSYDFLHQIFNIQEFRNYSTKWHLLVSMSIAVYIYNGSSIQVDTAIVEFNYNGMILSKTKTSSEHCRAYLQWLLLLFNTAIAESNFSGTLYMELQQ